MARKNLKIPFEVILRNKKTKEEFKIKDIIVPISVSVDKETLHKIMQQNVDKEVNDDKS